MIERIKKSELAKLISEHFNFEPRLKDHNYFRIDSIGSSVIILTQNQILSEFVFKTPEKVESFGIPIIKIIKKEVSILPRFIDCLDENYPTHLLNHNLQTEVSFGKSIHLSESDGLCFLADDQGIKVAFGTINDGIFQPLVDLGWYLRTGN
jgi:hypothetical protein